MSVINDVLLAVIDMAESIYDEPTATEPVETEQTGEATQESTDAEDDTDTEGEDDTEPSEDDTEPEESGLYAPILIGALPADNGICCTITGGWPEATFIDKGMSYELSLVLNGKHESQQVVSDTLNDIHQALTQTKTYPQTDAYQITNIETTASPSYIEREENKQYLYGSSLKVRFYYRKD